MRAGAKEKLLLVEKRSNMLKVMVMAMMLTGWLALVGNTSWPCHFLSDAHCPDAHSMMLMMLINFGPLCPDFLPTLGLFGGNCLLKL